MRRLSVLVLVTLVSVGTANPVSAADGQVPATPAAHTASPAALDAALQEHTVTTMADREAVLRVLDHARVKDIAGRLGVDMRQAKSAVAAMNGEQLAQVAAQAKTVDQALAGGASTVTISTTTIIIALLVIILIIVAVN
jgi:hypothetical protein